MNLSSRSIPAVFSNSGGCPLMKTPYIVTLFAFMLLTLSAAFAQPIEIEDWLFMSGDNTAYSQPGFNDSSWKQIAVPSSWEQQGFDYDGISWYRAHFEVPEKLIRDNLYLVLGRVDDVDETWLNGVKIGSSGIFPPRTESAWNINRCYRIPEGLLRKENIVAVRVYDMGGPGGIVTGPVGIYDEAGRTAMLKPPSGPHRTYYTPVTGNGLIAAVFDSKSGAMWSVLPHIFRAHDEKHPVFPAIRLITPRAAGKRMQPPQSVTYLENTHIIHADYGDLTIDWFCPFTTHEKILYAVVRGPAVRVNGLQIVCQAGKGTPLTGTHTFYRSGGKADRYFLFGFTDSIHRDPEVVQKACTRLVSQGGRLLDDELAYMRGLREKCHMPDGMTPSERNTFEQSISVLKMAQVDSHEIIPGAGGQILASLPPGVWNIAWVRDGYYATVALSRLGLYEEAREMLEFEMRAESSHYTSFTDLQGHEVGVGLPYRISVCRYYGDGTEESDGGRDPNIELDGFGLFLAAFSDYVTRSGDQAFYRNHVQTVRREVADVIVHTTDKDGLTRGESGPWERHMRFKKFAWTSIVNAAGLQAFAELEQRMGAGDSEKYALSARAMKKAILDRLVTRGGWIKGNLETTKWDAYDSHDGGTFEAFAMSLLNDAALFRSHMNEYTKVLCLPSSPGFSRINKGDAYEAGEWLLMDLRAASACARFGDKAAARRLVEWVTGQAAMNFNLIPEMLTPDTSAYDGSIPMVGFGAGAYVLAIFDLYGADIPVSPGSH